MTRTSRNNDKRLIRQAIFTLRYDKILCGNHPLGRKPTTEPFHWWSVRCVLLSLGGIVIGVLCRTRI